MGDEKRHVTSREPCPICGKPDWCCWYANHSSMVPGAMMLLCNRSKEHCDVMGLDGKNYVWMKETATGADLYMEEELYQESRRLYLEQKRSQGLYTPSANKHRTSTVQPKRICVEDLTKQPVADQAKSHKALDTVYRSLFQKLPLLPKHHKRLLDAGWTKEQIQASMIRTLPPDDFVRFEYRKQTGRVFSRDIPWRKELVEAMEAEGIDFQNTPGFYKTSSWKIGGLGGMIIPAFDQFGYLFRAEIATEVITLPEDSPEVLERKAELAKAKYRPFSTNPSRFQQGTGAGKFPSICYNPAKDHCYVAYITEGKKKGFIANYCMHSPVVCLDGVGSFGRIFQPIACADGVEIPSMAEWLWSVGCRILVVAYDADKHVNRNVMMSEERTVELAKAFGFKVAVAEWNGAFGKGLDDILVKGIYPNCSDFL